MFKVALATYPFILAWAIYVTTAIDFIGDRVSIIEATRFTLVDSIHMKEEIISHSPPEWVNRELIVLKRRMDTLDARDLVDRHSLDEMEKRLSP